MIATHPNSFIRSWWRFKYLPMTRLIWWWHLWRWTQFGLSIYAWGFLLSRGVLFRHEAWPLLIGVPVVVAYLQGVRYLTVRRSDTTRRQDWAVFLLAPLALLWAMTGLRFVKWYSYATVWRTGWGTRQKAVPEVSVAVGQS